MRILLMHRLSWASLEFKGTWCCLKADRHLMYEGDLNYPTRAII